MRKDEVVLDSNVALKWVLPEPDSNKANQLRVDFQNAIHELIAPDVSRSRSRMR